MHEEAFPGDNNPVLREIQAECMLALLKDWLARAAEDHRWVEHSIITEPDFLEWIRGGHQYAEEELDAMHLAYRLIAERYRLLRDDHGQLDFAAYLGQRSYETHVREQWQQYFAQETNRLLRSEAVLTAVLFAVHHHISRATVDYYKLAPSQINRTCERYLVELLYQHYGSIEDQYAAKYVAISDEEGDDA